MQVAFGQLLVHDLSFNGKNPGSDPGIKDIYIYTGPDCLGGARLLCGVVGSSPSNLLQRKLTKSFSNSRVNNSLKTRLRPI